MVGTTSHPAPRYILSGHDPCGQLEIASQSVQVARLK
jgi:hypothetical protein